MLNIYKSLYNPSSGNDGTINPMAAEAAGARHRFRQVARDGFNVTDQPDTRFFKILFYFLNDDQDENTPSDLTWYNGGSSGLLAPTWLDNPQPGNYYKYNSAWSYLKSNYEEERADTLVEFVTMLSEISTNSPWYFKSVGGVDEALTRSNFIVPDERKKITITCMPDPFDHRIESLLSMYRSIVWSHSRKCEVVPANLRKFDMGLFVFSSLTVGPHVKASYVGGKTSFSDWALIEPTLKTDDYNHPIANYKYIEFHNCEIDMDSIKSGFGTISNEDGFEQEFTIDIFFDDCYENEYNPYVLKEFGDFFVWDSFNNVGRTNSGAIAVPDDIKLGAIGNIGGLLNNLSTSNAQEISENARKDVSIKNQEQIVKDGLNPFGSGSSQSLWQRIKESAMNDASSVWSTIKNNWEGGLGNIYHQGTSFKTIVPTVEDELLKQSRLLTSRLAGNVNSTTTNLMRGATSLITKPALGSISTVADAVAESEEFVQKHTTSYALGSIYKVEGKMDEVVSVAKNRLQNLGNRNKTNITI